MDDLNGKQGGSQGMGGKKRASKALLPISTVQTAQALIRLYARLKGEISKAEAGEPVLVPTTAARQHMRRIAGLMPLLGINFDPDAINATKTRIPDGPLDWGDLRTGTLVVLRARGDWMTYREIAEGLLERRTDPVALDVRTMSKFVQKVRESLFFQVKARVVEKELDIEPGASDRPQRFRLSRTLFRR